MWKGLKTVTMKPDSTPMRCPLREGAVMFTVLTVKEWRHQTMERLPKVTGHITDEQVLQSWPRTGPPGLTQLSPLPPLTQNKGRRSCQS